MYEGTFNDKEEKHGEGKSTFTDFEFEGTFADGSPTTGTTTYQDTYAPDNETRRRKTYKGEVNADFQPNGAGLLVYENGDRYEGVLTDNVVTGNGCLKVAPDEFTGDVVNGVQKKGVMKYGEGNYKTFDGDFDDEGKRDGQGVLVWRDGHSFEGEHKANVHTNGKYSHSNGNVFEGAFNVDGKPFGEGVLTFKSGVTYAHKKDDEASFLGQVISFMDKLDKDSNDAITKAETELTALSIWPALPEVASDKRIPAELSQSFSDIKDKAIDPVNALREIVKSIEILVEEHGETLGKVKGSVESEAATDLKNRTRFGDRWKQPASDTLNQAHLSGLASYGDTLKGLAGTNDTLKADVEGSGEVFKILDGSLDDFEGKIKSALEETDTRAALAALLLSQVTIIEERKEELAKLVEEVKELDCMPALVDANDTEKDEVFKDELEKVQAARDGIADSTTKHLALLASIFAAHTAYITANEEVSKTSLAAVVDPLTAAITKFTDVEDKLKDCESSVRSLASGDIRILRENVETFTSERANAADADSKNLLTSEIVDAITSNDQGCLEKLLTDPDHRADPNHTAPDGSIPIMLAIRTGNPDFIRVLNKHGAKTSIRDMNSHTCLWVSIEENHHNLLPVLIQCGANPNAPEDEKTGESIMHLAAKSKQGDIVDIMIENGADVNVEDKDGNSVLLAACKVLAKDCIKALVKAGAGPNARNFEGESPLHFVEDEEIMEFLIERGARPGMKDKRKQSNVSPAQIKTYKATQARFKSMSSSKNLTKTVAKNEDGWVKDSDSKVCQMCRAPFSFFNRRHHCRHCGILCCGPCSSKTVVDEKKKKQRVCDACFNKHL